MYKHWVWIWVSTGESTDPVLGRKGVEVILLVYRFRTIGYPDLGRVKYYLE